MTVALERSFECPHCKIRAVVVVDASREVTPFRARVEPSSDDGDGQDTQDDATSTLGMVRCPACGQMPPHAILFSTLRTLGVTLGVAAVLWTYGSVRRHHGTNPYDLGLAVVGLAIGLVLGVLIEVRRWRASRHVRIIRMRAPVRDPGLPVAVARGVAPSRLAPLHTEAPDRGDADRGDQPPASGPSRLR